MKQSLRLLAASIFTALVVCGCSDNVTPPSLSQPPSIGETSLQQANELEESALSVLQTLETKGRAPKTHYSREQFGQAWVDINDAHCNTRDFILKRDLSAVQVNQDCTVRSGVLSDPYTSKTIQFTRGRETSDDIQIDHIVALADAWQKGIQEYDLSTRLKFANDPLNLQSVDGSTNQAKGDSDAASWLPPEQKYRCEYVARQISVKAAYGLWVTPAEKHAMEQELSYCPKQKTYRSDVATKPVNSHLLAQQSALLDGIESPSTASSQNIPESTSDNAQEPFKNCAEARAQSQAPVHSDHPRYGKHLDGDSDGIGCENP